MRIPTRSPRYPEKKINYNCHAIWLLLFLFLLLVLTNNSKLFVKPVGSKATGKSGRFFHQSGHKSNYKIKTFWNRLGVGVNENTSIFRLSFSRLDGVPHRSYACHVLRVLTHGRQIWNVWLEQIAIFGNMIVDQPSSNKNSERFFRPVGSKNNRKTRTFF